MKIDLLHGDCLELMKSIPDGSVDLCLTDPPYGTTACKWDTVIPFEPMWEQLKRIVKPNGAICLFGSEPFSSALRMSNIKEFKYDWYWLKNNVTGFMQAKTKPLNSIEVVSVFGRFKTAAQYFNGTYRPQGLVSVGQITYENNRKEDHITGNRSSAICQSNSGYPKNRLEFKNEQGFHPTQKPVALLEYLIKTYTIEGETVLDFTMGSGSTGVAAKNLNRNFIGIEKDAKYFEIAKQRIGVKTDIEVKDQTHYHF